MRIAILGQQPFGKAVFEAFIGRGDTIAGVFCAPDKGSAAPDPLRTCAEQAQVAVFQLASLRSGEAHEILRGLKVDLGVMAYVLQFAPESFTSIPTHGTIQYHPSLLPRHRGPSSINWPIILGESQTGLSIFRPTDGLDEGPILLQKSTPIGADESLGQVYFKRLFPMGVAALLEAADLALSGAVAKPQDEALASYEGWCRGREARVNWHAHAEQIYNLIRGCDPAPGAWTIFKGRKLELFDARHAVTRKFLPGSATVGTVVAVTERGFTIAAHGGSIVIGRVRDEDGAKVPAADYMRQCDLGVGSILGE